MSNKEYKYKKKGGGSLRLNGNIIKPNQEFTARPEDIPDSFKDTIEPLEEIPEEDEKPTGDFSTDSGNESEAKEEKTINQFEIKNKGGPWFDVINTETGKVQNETGLKEDEAKKYRDLLNAKEK